MSYYTNNILSATPVNSNAGYNNSWVAIENNADRELYAQLNYITNLSDLTIQLTASNIDIGHVKLQDADSELKANVVTVSPGVGGLVVSVANPVTSVNATISNPVTSVNATISNPVTSVTISNPVTSVNATISNPVTNWDVLSASITQNVFTTLSDNAANSITIVNDTGHTLYVKNASKTLALPLLDKNALELSLIGNTNEVAIKQTNSGTPPIIYAVFTKY